MRLIILSVVVLLLASAIAKLLVFETVLDEDSGRQRIEQGTGGDR